MNWTKISDSETRSDRGNYAVRAHHTAGTTFYEAWQGNVFLSRGEDPDGSGMRQVCEQHHARAPKSVELHENNDGV